MPRGGRRPGSGRKPNRVKPHVLAVVPPRSVPVFAPPSDVLEPPEGMPEAEQAVWRIQAPHAVARGTLTRVEAEAFRRYCELTVIAREKALTAQRGDTSHLTLVNLINRLELQFLLVPDGKPVAAVAEAGQPESKLAQFRRQA